MLLNLWKYFKKLPGGECMYVPSVLWSNLTRFKLKYLINIFQFFFFYWNKASKEL